MKIKFQNDVLHHSLLKIFFDNNIGYAYVKVSKARSKLGWKVYVESNIDFNEWDFPIIQVGLTADGYQVKDIHYGVRRSPKPYESKIIKNKIVIDLLEE